MLLLQEQQQPRDVEEQQQRWDVEEEASPLPPAPDQPRLSARKRRPVGEYWKCVAKHNSRALRAARRSQSLALHSLLCAQEV